MSSTKKRPTGNQLEPGETMTTHRLLIASIALFACSPSLFAAETKLPLLVKEDFEHGAVHWKTTDPNPADSVWQIIETGPKGNHAYRVTGPSTYKPSYRSPFSIALLKDIKVTDFELTASVQNTARNAGAHRDLCIIWGYQDPSHFYYVHLGARPDPHACQIFIVKDAPRTMITEKKAKGTPWDDDWHNVKVTRNVKDGVMDVYFDDMKTPLMTARDKTFTWGQVGIGTFDDNGNFDDVTLRGNEKK